MKELSLLSLICSCFHTQPHPNTIYQYGGTYIGVMFLQARWELIPEEQSMSQPGILLFSLLS